MRHVLYMSSSSIDCVRRALQAGHRLGPPSVCVNGNVDVDSDNNKSRRSAGSRENNKYPEHETSTSSEHRPSPKQLLEPSGGGGCSFARPLSRNPSAKSVSQSNNSSTVNRQPSTVDPQQPPPASPLSCFISPPHPSRPLRRRV